MFARPSARRPATLPIVYLFSMLVVSATFAPATTFGQPAAGEAKQPTQVAVDDDAPAPAATASPTAKPTAEPAAKPQATSPAATATASPTASSPTASSPTASSPTATAPAATASGTPSFSPLGSPAAPPPAAAPSGTEVQVVSLETKPVATALDGGLKLLLILGVFVASAVLANVFAKMFRMPDHVWRFFFVTFAVVTGAVTMYLGWPPKLGVDLRGGINLIYEIKPTEETKNVPAEQLMDQLVGTINKRINPGGIKEVLVRPFGSDRVEIIIPGADAEELERIKKLIYSAGNLEFRILANHHKYQNEIDAALAQQRREEAAKKSLSNVVDGERNDKKVTLARWVPVEATRAASYIGSNKYAVREVPVGDRVEVQVLCVIDPYNVTGQYLTSATPGLDDRGDHCVLFTFNGAGATLFEQLTGTNLPDRAGQTNELGIVLDGYLQSSPSIQSTISDRGQITGNFSEREVKDLSEILSAGGLPTALNRVPVSEVLTGPSLGEDTIHAAVTSMYVAVGVVVVFMLVYYRFAGLVANIALILNVLLTVAFMIMFNAAFTLSGLAGLALTVGMAVDANVLIYERMREELSRGATLRMAIRNGFDRASVTIIDANVTTLITAVVLFIIGTDQVKGFAVALTVGLSWNLFTAITVSRLIFETAERNRWVSNLKFLQVLGATNIDFIGKRYVCYTLSILMLGAGLIGTVLRGSDLLNIDFTGGTSITAVFEQAPSGGIAEVRQKIEKELPEATVQQLTIPEYPDGAGFKIVTAAADRAEVEKTLKTLFGTQLAYHHMTYGELGTIEKSPPAAADGPALTPPADGPKPNDGSSLPASDDGEQLASSCGQDATAADAKSQATTEPAKTENQPEKPAGDAAKKPADDPVLPEDTDPFSGGTFVTLSFKPDITYRKLSEQLQAILQPDPEAAGTRFELSTQGYESGSSQGFPSWNLRVALPPTETENVLKQLNHNLTEAPFFPSSEVVGAAVAGSAQESALTAMIVSLALVLAYIWFRFQNVAFGFAAIVALVHDVMFTVGCLALSKWLAPVLGFAMVDPFKIDLTIVAAVLTIIGYSLNDTIVIFDRIREVRGKSKGMSADLINLCVNQTLSRTILTSLTVFLVVLILYVWGGPGIHGFAFALVVGTMSGTYSTIYVASPVLLWLHERSQASARATRAAAQAS